MNIKIQCSCGTKFSFDVEPVDGKMPIEIVCPKCGADATAAANSVIAASLNTPAIAASPAAEKPRPRLQVAGHAAKSVSTSAPSEGNVAAAPVAEMCHRHTRNVAVEHCVVCQKPICPECMQTFGYLCSIACRYRADQEKIHVPKFKFQKGAVEKQQTRKAVGMTLAVLSLVLLLLGAWGWYITVGDKPREFYSLKVTNKSGTYAKFLSPTQVLLLSRDQATLHDIKTKKDIWSTDIQDPKPAPEKPAEKPATTKASARKIVDLSSEDFEDFSDYSSEKPEPFFHGEDLWLCLSHNVVRINLKSGEIKQTTPFRGRLSAFTPGESSLLVVSENGRNREILTQIPLESGEVKTEEVGSSLREKVATSKDLPENVMPTAALLLKRELEAALKQVPSIYKFSSEFFPAGENMVEMQVKLVEPKVTTVQTMKAAGPSNLNQDTRASTSARSVAEEIFNEMKRNDTGGFKQVDESRYNVLLRRTLEKDATDWSGEVVGLPVFFPMKTVDVLVAGTNLFLFNKQNKKIAESNLAYPVDERFTSGLARKGSAPCVERDGVLYFFDQGVLTAFTLPDGAVRWRLTSVGIREIQFDTKGNLYVSTTTGAPEDIQYSEQIKMNDAPQPIILKVSPEGKTLWKCSQSGGGLFLTGKYVYITDAARVGFSMIHAVEQAFGTERAPGSFRIIRINPSNGKKAWAFVKKGAPENIDFCENRILLHYGNEIEFMKFISF